ncbi:2Fe-2S iron-sulfur cluster-binding protein [Arthrobacter sp. NPDC090010]|uniref:2Fe-2S iron-sulfur cluster-binding protein n=1 Tax=Arthrobacter sp. NPDC090010 TaxID=3363942 RepID=UPI00380D7C57
MPKITYIGLDDSVEVEATEGQSIMRAAVLNGIGGIVGECGGQAMCATCHVFVEGADCELPDIEDDEAEMLECTADERRSNSRLGCQLSAGSHFSEIIVRLPQRQV